MYTQRPTNTTISTQIRELMWSFRKIAPDKQIPKAIPSRRSLLRFGNTIVKYSCNAPTVTIKKTAANNHGGLQPTRSTNNGRPSAAVKTLELRLPSTGTQSKSGILDLFVRSTKSAPPTLIVQQRLKIFPLPKIRP